MSPLHLSDLRDGWASLDKIFFGSVELLICLGILCIFSAASGGAGRGWEYALRQSVWGLISLVAYFVITFIGYRKFMDWAYPLYSFSLLVLLFTAILAPRVKGAQSWLSLGLLRFQPSEFAKISLALVLAKFLSRYPPLNLKAFFAGVGIAAPAILLLMLQPDMGSAIVFIVILIGALFVAGMPVKYLLLSLCAMLLLLPCLWFFLRYYQKMRLLVFFDPTRDPLGAGYNVIQSRIAVGSGSFLGKGFMQGLQSKLRFLPEPHTDFIFSVYAEEFGFLGSALLLVAFGVIFARMFVAGVKARDVRCKILVAAVASWLWFQMFESIGMSIGLMPVTGLPLPFLSYGGSSLLALSMALGLVSSIYTSVAKPYK